MNNERTKILKMLENGEINAEEASRLLAALENRNSGESFNTSNNNSNNNYTNRDAKINNFINRVSDVTSTILKKGSKVVNGIEKEVKHIVKNISEQKSEKNSATFSKEFNYNLLSFENNIRLSSLNGEMHLKGYNGDKLTLRALYEPLTTNANIEFYNSGDNNYILSFNQGDFKKVSIEVLMPIKYFKQIDINNVESNFSVDSLKFETLISRTHNSNGIIENCECSRIDLDNTKGKFIVRNILAENLNIKTINGFVKLKNLDVKNLNVDNINGEIEAINDYFNKYNDYKWVLETQNSPINVEINTDNVNYKIKGQTTLGSIDINKSNLFFKERTNYTLIAETENKNLNYKNIDISLITTNSKILLS